MRSTNMFYGYKRLCDARMGGYGKGYVRRRRHSDGIAETIKALLEKALAFVSSLIDKIIAKFAEVKQKFSKAPAPTPEAKQTYKDYLKLAAKTLKQAKVAQKALKVALGGCVAFGAAYLGLKAKEPLLQKIWEVRINKKYPGMANDPYVK